MSRDFKISLYVAMIAGSVTLLSALLPYYIKTHPIKKATPNNYNGPLVIDSTSELDLNNPLCLVLRKAIDDFPNSFKNVKGEHKQRTSSSDIFNIKNLPPGYGGSIEIPINSMSNGEFEFRLEAYNMNNEDSALKTIIEFHNMFRQCQDGFVSLMNANSIKGEKVYYVENFIRGEIVFVLKCWGPFYELGQLAENGRYYVNLSCNGPG
jgi:hypothetical protein